MYSIFTRQPIQIVRPATRESRFFRNVDYSTVYKAFLEKGWKMWLEELNSGEVILHWESLAGSQEHWVGLNPIVLWNMWANKQQAVAWLALFAAGAEKIN